MRNINMLRADVPAPTPLLFERSELARVGLVWLVSMLVLAGALTAVS